MGEAAKKYSENKFQKGKLIDRLETLLETYYNENRNA
jgi:hypothetical protein